MSATNKRQISTDNTRGPHKIADLTYNDQAGATKTLGPILGQLTPIGDLAAAKQVVPGGIVAVFNATAAVHYVKFGDAAVAAPTNGGDGLPVPAGQYALFAVGPNTYIRSDVALVWGYSIADDTYVQ